VIRVHGIRHLCQVYGGGKAKSPHEHVEPVKTNRQTREPLAGLLLRRALLLRSFFRLFAVCQHPQIAG
jgi:hypothetical protein